MDFRREYFSQFSLGVIDCHWRTDSRGAKIKTLNDWRCRFSNGDIVCKQHTALTALVLWTYNIALEPNVCYLEVAPMLSCRCLVSVERFWGFSAAYLICLKVMNGYNADKKNMGNVVCVWDCDYSACVIFVAALKDAQIHKYTQTHLIFVLSPDHIWGNTSPL